MLDALDKELTRADIRIVAAVIYEPEPRVWKQGAWQCPQCRKLNNGSRKQCACYISRDGLPEFRKRWKE